MKPKAAPGNIYGRWTVLDDYQLTPRGERRWLCRCTCGTKRTVLERSLLYGGSLSCGCLRSERSRKQCAHNLAGQTFGQLTVLSQLPERGANGSIRWLCRCTCGNTCTVSGSLLVNGRKTHCGCQNARQYRYADIAGQQFGRLTALYPIEERTKRGGMIWHCRCACGNETDVAYNELLFTPRQSCGCQKLERNAGMQELLTHVAGTSVDHLKSKKVPASNTTGYKGVYRIRNKYTAKIVFQKKQYYFGTYASAAEAAEARLEAEEIFAASTVRYYERWKACAEADPEWGRNNPVQIHVERSASGFPMLTFLPPLEDAAP